MEAFNVITDPWIPVIKKDETREVYGVRDMLKNAADIKRIISPGNLPSEEYAIYRFLFALLTDAYEIRSDEDIEEIYRSGEFDLDAFDEYVKRCGNIFNVFDEEHPFMQCGVKKALEYGAKPVSAATLSFGKPSGNTDTFFGLRGDSESQHDLNTKGKTYEELQHLSIPEYIALVINVSFMHATLTSGVLAAVCGNQPPLWFMFNGENLFDTICLNLYPTDEDDVPMWRRGDYLWNPKEEPEGWLALAFMSTRIIAPLREGVKEGKIFQYLSNFTIGRNAELKDGYLTPDTFYDMWKSKEPYIVLKYNDPSKIKKKLRQHEIEAWKGPTGIAWMHMAEFYGVKLDTTKTKRPKVMQVFDHFSDKEKKIIQMLPYKPTQSFYHFTMYTQTHKEYVQEVYCNFPATEVWMYEDFKLGLVNDFTAYIRMAMDIIERRLKNPPYKSNQTSEKKEIPEGMGMGPQLAKEVVSSWTDECEQYMFNVLIPHMEKIEPTNIQDYYEKSVLAVINITKNMLNNIIIRDPFLKMDVSNQLLGELRVLMKRR